MKTKRTIILKEPQLRQIIQNAVRNYLESEAEGTKNLTINGEIPVLGNYAKGFDDREYIESILSESLNTTSPTDKTIKIISRQFDLSSNQIQKQLVNDNGTVVTLLSIILPLNITKNTIGDINHTMRACGYSAIQKLEPDLSDKRFGVLLFEPTFLTIEH